MDSTKIGPTIIGGDFNAHLGSLGGPKGLGDPNVQGILLDQLCKRNDLFIATLSTHASGPSYTYHSGSMKTTVDYIILDPQSALLFEDCLTHDEDALNISDHLPQSVVVNIDLLEGGKQNKQSRKINWSVACESDSCIVAYQEEVKLILSPLLGKIYDTVEEIDKDITEVSSLCVRLQKLLYLLSNQRTINVFMMLHSASCLKTARVPGVLGVLLVALPVVRSMRRRNCSTRQYASVYIIVLL